MRVVQVVWKVVKVVLLVALHLIGRVAFAAGSAVVGFTVVQALTYKLAAEADASKVLDGLVIATSTKVHIVFGVGLIVAMVGALMEVIVKPYLDAVNVKRR